MAKINIVDSDMAMFMLCEAIGEERKEFTDLRPNEDGLYDVVITLNGKEVNTERFLKSLQISYDNAVKEKAANMLSAEYDKMLGNIHEIQEALEHHKKLFEEKVYV